MVSQTYMLAGRAFELALQQERDEESEGDLTAITEADIQAEELLYAAYRRCHFIKIRLEAKGIKLQAYLDRGGRRSRRPTRHQIFEDRLRADYSGLKEKIEDGVVVTEKTDALFTERAFYRRFRMSPEKFAEIFNAVSHVDTGIPEFLVRPDVALRIGASALQKIVSTFRQLAYGCTADIAEEYTGVQEEQGRKTMLAFCRWLDVFYGPKFLGAWTVEAIRKEMAINAARGFTGMLGSIDCTHWGWKNCPMVWAGQYHDRSGIRSVIAEAVAGSDMYFWHAEVGFPGAINDIQVLARSSFSMIYLESPAVNEVYYIGGVKFTGAFFLADGIYPPSAYFMKTIGEPSTEAEQHFARMQEGCRKDVERAFGRLLSKWHILDRAARTWFLPNIKVIWKGCFILHNITLRDNQATGHDSDDEGERTVQLRREHARVRALRRARAGLEEVAAGAEDGEGGERTRGEGARAERQRLRRERRRERGGRNRARGAGRGNGVRSSVYEMMDDADEAHDHLRRGVDMGVAPEAVQEVLVALRHAECPETHRLRKQKTIEALWMNRGSTSGPAGEDLLPPSE